MFGKKLRKMAESVGFDGPKILANALNEEMNKVRWDTHLTPIRYQTVQSWYKSELPMHYKYWELLMSVLGVDLSFFLDDILHESSKDVHKPMGNLSTAETYFWEKYKKYGDEELLDSFVRILLSKKNDIA